MACRQFPGLGTALLPLLLVALLAACVSAESWEATRVLKDIEAGRGPSDHKTVTPEPARTTVAYGIGGRRSLADLYRPNQPVGAGLVLVPGFTPQGKDDPRLVALAETLARARFLVLVPELAGTRQLRVTPEDARGIADGVVHLAESGLLEPGREVGIVAVSYAVGLAVLASEAPEVRERLGFLVAIGGYHDTTAVITFATTGAYRATRAENWSRAEPNPAAKWLLLASNLDLIEDPGDREVLSALAERLRRRPQAPAGDLAAELGPEGRALWEVMANDDPDRARALLEELPKSIESRLDALSPASRNLSHLADRLILIHGRADTLIPYTESLKLARAVPGSEIFLIDGFSHIEHAGVGLAGQLQLISAVQAVLERRAE